MTHNTSVEKSGASVGAMDPLRDSERPERYSVIDRWADKWAGHRDGKRDARLLAESEYVDQPTCANLWLARNKHLFAERDRREYLAAQAQAAPMISRLQMLNQAVVGDKSAVRSAVVYHNSMPTQPPEEELKRRGPAERDDSEAIIEARRRSALTRQKATAEATLAAAVDQMRSTESEAALLQTELLTLFETTKLRSQRLREHHERRAAQYLRSRRRLLARRVDAAHLGEETEAIPVPDWTEQPCPWVVLAEDRAPTE